MIFLTLCLGHSGEKRRWLTWWWVGSAGGGGCWTDLVCPHIQWDSECLAETPVQDIFNFNLWQKSEGQHSEGGCGCSVWVNHVLNLRCWGWCTELCLAITRWWTHPPEVNWAVKLKRKSFFFFLIGWLVGFQSQVVGTCRPSVAEWLALLQTGKNKTWKRCCGSSSLRPWSKTFG